MKITLVLFVLIKASNLQLDINHLCRNSISEIPINEIYFNYKWAVLKCLQRGPNFAFNLLPNINLVILHEI